MKRLYKLRPKDRLSVCRRASNDHSQPHFASEAAQRAPSLLGALVTGLQSEVSLNIQHQIGLQPVLWLGPIFGAGMLR